MDLTWGGRSHNHWAEISMASKALLGYLICPGREFLLNFGQHRVDQNLFFCGLGWPHLWEYVMLVAGWLQNAPQYWCLTNQESWISFLGWRVNLFHKWWKKINYGNCEVEKQQFLGETSFFLLQKHWMCGHGVCPKIWVDADLNIP